MTTRDAAPTRVLASATPTSLRPQHSHPGTIELPDPESALRRSEIEQTKRTALSGLVFNALGVAAAPLLGGVEWARLAFAIGCFLAFFNNAWLLWICMADARYRQSRVVTYFGIATLPNAAILLYLGTFGPLLVMFVYNVYVACLAYRRAVARVILVGSIAPPLVLGLAIAFGVVEDPGVIAPREPLPRWGEGVLITVYAAFLVMTYQQGRRGRELMVASLVERDAAVRAASHREALFLEARQDLERALQAGGLGRFSDQTLGSYKLGAVLGRGGMGEVYEAVHVETGEAAAVKMLLPEMLGRANYVRRFLREVKIASSLDSPHVVRVVEVGDESAPIPYLAMERLEGDDLSQLLRKRGRLPGREVCTLVRQVGRGVTAAAEAGIVHRDLKPRNLFRTGGDRPVWKILDFGVSKSMHTSDTLTKGDAIGTPHYMAPEQARGRAVDIRTDLYALGAIAYRALTGHRPFGNDDAATVLVDVLETMPRRPSSLAKLRSAIDDVLAIAMAKAPADRFATADDLADALDAAVRGEIADDLRDRAARLRTTHPWHGESDGPRAP